MNTISDTRPSIVPIKDESGIFVRKPKITDGPAITAMVRESGILDVNSDYAYLLMCTHFSMTCAIAEKDSEHAAFVTAYIPPEQQDTLFIWQICVRPAYQRLGLGVQLINALLDRIECRHVRFVEATINPSNLASQKLFQSLAEQYGTACKTSDFFTKDLFGSSHHEDEVLYKVGPLR
ncbi:diaminobutyrate acetyltransferase [Nitrosomonas nitrosa]|jgi:L-2,4-diaminobutyric acid acetyltransferase|uniref:L-2,4-diaminobutyric acid acetyltransferase n=1 Tax=Nitrosomonas nitrosa TaxID=52442 RepID=A0A1I4S7G4_9PROT|nr:diaminobutyrate acetyltransferase [Nitrosomonas nitrosa]PTQ98414.1 diaminobutyrate acetyltransferase [Nitrosomonas nitrosa]SFM60448.1 diaminobutyrate acetyltransferase [Nitrosomonas nitrosa]